MDSLPPRRSKSFTRSSSITVGRNTTFAPTFLSITFRCKIDCKTTSCESFGTVSVEAVYKDGQTYSQLGALQPNLSGVQTTQLVRDTPLNNLGSGQVFRNKVSFLHKIPWLWIAIVDGQQQAKFAATSNIQLIETSADA